MEPRSTTAASREAFEAERAEAIRPRVRWMFTALCGLWVLVFLYVNPIAFGSRWAGIWLQAANLAVVLPAVLWLRRPRRRPALERATVGASLSLVAVNSLGAHFGAEAAFLPSVVSFLVLLLVTPPLATLSWRGTLAFYLGGGGAILALLVTHGGLALEQYVLGAAPFVAPAAFFVINAALRERLFRAEFDARRGLEEANRRLRDEEQARSRLFVNLSHDFRTPLAVIRGEAEHLGGGTSDPAVRAALGRIAANAQAVTDLTEQLLELARLDAGRPGRKVVDVDLAELADEVAAQLRPAVGGEVRVVREGGSTVARADLAHARRILTNLAANALRAAGPGGRVELRLGGGEAAVTADVVDSGPGVPPERRAAIFERFTSFAPEGSTASGIGLPLARELAELNGGTLALLEGEPRTTFRLTLPGGHGAPAPLGPQAPRPAPAPLVSQGVRAPIVVIEDSGDMRSLLSRVLEEGYSVQLAADLAQGKIALEAVRPRAVICDVMLPDGDGYTLLEWIRGRPELADVPVLLLSALSEPGERARGLRAGAADYVVKPFAAEELRARVAAAIRRADDRSAALRAQREELLMEIHDGVGASLARASALVAAARRDGASAERFAHVEATLRQGIEEARGIMALLEREPVPFEELAASVRRSVAEDCEGAGLRCQIAGGEGAGGVVPVVAAHVMLRIAREALTNVVRHARATGVRCAVDLGGGELRLGVEDDGVGFDPAQARGRGLGIMARRAARLGGRLEIDAAPGCGTRIRLVLPVAEAPAV